MNPMGTVNDLLSQMREDPRTQHMFDGDPVAHRLADQSATTQIGQASVADPNDPAGAKAAAAPAEAQKPDFRAQPNAHDHEVEQIKGLLDQLESSQKSDMQSAHRQRAAELWAKAGNAVAHGFAPDRVESIANTPLTPLPSMAGGSMNKIKATTELNQDLFKRENPEQERLLKQDLATKKLLEDYARLDEKEKEEAAKAKAKIDAAALAETNTDRRFHEGEKTKKDINAATNATGIGVAEIGAGGNVGRGMGEKAASEEYSQAERENKEDYRGNKYHSRGVVSLDQSNMLDKVLAHHGGAAPAIDRLAYLLKTNPRSYAAWGSDARSALKSALTSAVEGVVKMNEDGAVTGTDAQRATSQLGSPETPEQFVANNSSAGVSELRDMVETQVRARAHSLGYDPGEGKSSKLEDVRTRANAAGATAAGGGKHPRVKAQDVINAGEAARGGKHAELPEHDTSTPDIPSRSGGLSYDPKTGKLVEH